MPLIPIGDIEPPWFYAVSAMLGEGSIILPGNWGRIHALRRKTDIDKFRWACEQTYDDVRKRFQPRAPSRLQSLFLCPKIAEARNFLKGSPGRTDVIYEVEPVEKPDRVCVNGWDSFDRGDYECPYPLARWQEQAFRYWTEKPERKREILLDCPVRILRQR